MTDNRLLSTSFTLNDKQLFDSRGCVLGRGGYNASREIGCEHFVSIYAKTKQVFKRKYLHEVSLREVDAELLPGQKPSREPCKEC